MMTDPSRRHGQIAMNIGARLKPAMDRRGCQTFAGDVRVQRGTDRNDVNKPRPDIFVRCGPSTRAEQALNFITDPIVIVEVLSPSTIDDDRGDKLAFYKSLPSVLHVVLVYQDQVRVEHYASAAASEWSTEGPAVLTSDSDVLNLTAVEFELAVSDAYYGVEF